MFVNPEPIPAPDCIKTLCPRDVAYAAAAGVMPTRYSWFLISVGQPIIMIFLQDNVNYKWKNCILSLKKASHFTIFNIYFRILI